jgi:hypothetical protein
VEALTAPRIRRTLAVRPVSGRLFFQFSLCESTIKAGKIRLRPNQLIVNAPLKQESLRVITLLRAASSPSSQRRIERRYKHHHIADANLDNYLQSMPGFIDPDKAKFCLGSARLSARTRPDTTERLPLAGLALASYKLNLATVWHHPK